MNTENLVIIDGPVEQLEKINSMFKEIVDGTFLKRKESETGVTNLTALSLEFLGPPRPPKTFDVENHPGRAFYKFRTKNSPVDIWIESLDGVEVEYQAINSEMSYWYRYTTENGETSGNLGKSFSKKELETALGDFPDKKRFLHYLTEILDARSLIEFWPDEVRSLMPVAGVTVDKLKELADKYPANRELILSGLARLNL